MTSSQGFEADVVVIGAGLSGLQAAYSLTEAGISTVVLEARSRVGGKTWSVPNENATGIADLGAEWLNDTTQPLVYQLATRLGLEFNEVKVQGESILQGFDNNLIRHEYGEQALLPGDEHKVVGRIKELFEEESRKIDLETFKNCPHDDVTLEEFVRSNGGGEATLATVAVWARVMLGCEPSDLSAAYFLAYCKSQGGLMKMRSAKVQGKYVTVKTGTQSIAQGLVDLLPPGTVKTDTAVQSIVQSDDSVTAYSTNGVTFRSKKVILAFSTPLYKKIIFDPPLPSEKALLVTSTKLGYYSKVLATYNRPWWRESGLSGASQSFIGPGTATRDTSEESKSIYRLTSFIAGAQGEKWSALTPAERRAAALGQFAEMFGSEEALNPTQYIEQQWSLEEWSMGCPCPYTPPGILTKVGGHYKQPFKHAHFVGTEMAVEWIGYMEGALASGRRGADEVIECLKN
ncbi:amine oxidase [Xylariaceae sp. FL1272]|nr:amine oxidase [Xylariaceae sp. FL1272]